MDCGGDNTQPHYTDSFSHTTEIEISSQETKDEKAEGLGRGKFVNLDPDEAGIEASFSTRLVML